MNSNNKKLLSFKRVISGFVIFCMIITMQAIPVSASSSTVKTSSYDNILKAKEAVKAAKKAVKEAENKYQKQLNGEDLSDEDLENIGWDFINMMVETAYEKDKEKVSKDDLVPLKKLTIEGNINKAYGHRASRAAINRINRASKSESKTFEGMIKRSLSIKNINKAIDLIEKCNSYRKARGLKLYKISPYLMAGAAVSGIITYKTGSHTYPHSGRFVTVNGTKVSESYAWGYKDPFYVWYTVERRNAANGTGTTSHFRAIVSTKYVQTGAAWYDKVKLAEQCFTKSSKGTSYTTSEFRKLFKEYVKKRKQEIADEKKALLNSDEEPAYLVNARNDLTKAQNKLKKALKAYVPTFTAVNYNYRTIKVKFKIPDEYAGIEIERSDSGKKGNFENIKTSKKGTYIYDSDKPTGVTLYYRIRFFKKLNGEKVYSKYSEVLSATTMPSKVRNVKVKVSKKYKKINLSWLELHGATGYEISAKGPDDKYYKTLVPGEKINGLTLKKSSDTSSPKAVIVYNKSGDYRFKIRAYTVNEEEGVTVKGNYSEVVKVRAS